MKKLIITILALFCISCIKIERDNNWNQEKFQYQYVAQKCEDCIKYYKILNVEDGLIYISDTVYIKYNFNPENQCDWSTLIR